LVKNEAKVFIQHLSGFSVVDLFDGRLSEQERDQLFLLARDFHIKFFPESLHAISEWQEQIEAGKAPTDEIVHVWLIFRDDLPVGLWAVNVNVQLGVALMLFGAVEKSARVDLPATWLRIFLDALIDLCAHDCAAVGGNLEVVALESEIGLTSRWDSAGFTLTDIKYFEPKLGMHWKDSPSIEFFEHNLLYVRSLMPTTQLKSAVVIQRALQAFVVDHYGLNQEIPQVQTMLAQAAELGR
jgi:hypothetical protein